MKRIFGTLLTIALAMAIVGTLYAEEEFTDENSGKCLAYTGRVVEVKTEVVTLTPKIVTGESEEGSKTPYLLPYTITVTYFTVWPVESNAKSYREKIENGNGKDMSAVIAVVQEAFTSGEMIHVVKCTEPVQPLYDEIEELKKELDQLPAVRDQKLTALRSEYSSAMLELIALLRAGKITLAEYLKRRSELYYKFTNACSEVVKWFNATNEQLNDHIASLEAKIEYILNNPKLRSVSIDKGMMKISEEPTAVAE